MPVALALSFGTALAAWFLIDQCPATDSGVSALQSTWFWAGYACSNHLGFGAVVAAAATFYLVFVHAILNIFVLSPSTRPTTKYIGAVAAAIVFFCLYILTFLL